MPHRSNKKLILADQQLVLLRLRSRTTVMTHFLARLSSCKKTAHREEARLTAWWKPGSKSMRRSQAVSRFMAARKQYNESPLKKACCLEKTQCSLTPKLTPYIKCRGTKLMAWMRSVALVWKLRWKGMLMCRSTTLRSAIWRSRVITALWSLDLNCKWRTYRQIFT